MRTRFVRETVRRGDRDDRRRPDAAHVGRPALDRSRRRSASRPGHTSLAGWCQVAAARGRGVTVYATLLGSPTRAERNDDLESLLDLGARAVPRRAGRPAGPRLRDRRGRLRQGAARARRGDVRCSTVARLGRPLTETVVAAASRLAARPAGRRFSGASRSGRDHALWGRATSLLPGRLTSRVSSGGYAGTPAGRSTTWPTFLTTDDRHRHTQRGDRPHADRAELPARAAASRERRRHARRRQGHQRRARAEGARRTGRRDRPRRRRARARASSRS